MEKKLVEHLVKSELLSRKELQGCVLRAAMSESSVVDEITNRLSVDQQQLAECMADYWGLSVWGEESIDSQPFALQLLGPETAKEFGVLPVVSELEDDTITLAVYDVEKAQPAIEKVRKKTGVSPKLVLVPREMLEREIFRHYQQDGSDETPTGNVKPVSSAPAHGVLQPRRTSRRSRERPKRTTPGSAREKDSALASTEMAPPTRQVDLTTDNPFMDLVQKSGKSSKSSTADTAPPPTIAMQPGDEDFFDGFENFSKDSAPAAVEPSCSETSESGEQEISDIEGALDAFDAELDAESEQEEVPISSTVDWGDAGSGRFSSEAGSSGSGLRSPGKDAVSSYDVEGSGIFPLDRDPSGFFDLGEETDGELTLADVVSRQRRLIQKLEREIEYQKGILQTMAELLIEARVFSRRKLKSRLKALKKEQKKRIDSQS